MSAISIKQIGWFVLLCCGLLTAVACDPIAPESIPPEIEIAPLETGSTESIPVEEGAMQPVYLLGDGRIAPGWHSSGTIQWGANDFGLYELGRDNFETGIDPNVSHNGGQSGFIRGLISNARIGALMQTITAVPYRGHRVAFSVYLKTEDVENAAGAGAVVLDGNYRSINGYLWHYQNLKGSNDWQQVNFVLDVPEEAVYLSLETVLRGKGTIWADDWTIKIVDETVPITQAFGFINPSFEEVNNNIPIGWFLDGRNPQDYEIGEDTQHVRHGQSSVTITAKAETDDETRFATLMQSFPAKPYWGQRLRFSGFMRAELAGSGGMWARVDGAPGELLRFDNTESREPVRGSSDWQLLTIVLDVPEGSSTINFGFSLAGNGQLWLDDVLLETVGDEVGVTGSARSGSKWSIPLTPFLKDPAFSTNQLGNATSSWFASGIGVEAYEIGVDTAVGRTNGQSGYVKHNDGDGLGTLAQALLAEQYRGERVQVRAYIRAENIDQQASFWMRVNGGQLIGLAVIPLGNTDDWQLQELTLDIPLESLYIAFGVTNAGQGTVWIDDVEFNVVDESVPTTNGFDAVDFTNLDFEAAIE